MINLIERDRHFRQKYGDLDDVGWSPKQRHTFGYTLPGDVYEAYIDKLVTNDTKWIDVGGGKSIFPFNQELSEALSKRCEKLVAVDPSENVLHNKYASESHCMMLEEFSTDEKFNLATLNMVAEHIENPHVVIKKLNQILEPGGTVVIYTINKFSPIPIITYLTPFTIHYRIKKYIWGGEEEDTFPVAYKMNTAATLKQLFESRGFVEVDFQYLEDLSVTLKFRILDLINLTIWKLFRLFHIRYPEFNLLATFTKKQEIE
jgi:2-polyprenyl-3-methyl-5-hydroxy-6-metoxy-1,4-benzoquinol methylase